eukprot:COSAG02_NODE_7731_length_2871_cov_28.438312_2_plen_89_part_00
MRHGLKPAPPPYQLSKQLHHFTVYTSILPNYPVIFNPFARDVPATLTKPEPRTRAGGKANRRERSREGTPTKSAEEEDLAPSRLPCPS